MSRSNLVTLRLSAILLAPTLLAHAQQSPTTSTLQGTVLNAITHQPIARALVTLDRAGQSTLTDNEGRFAFSGIAAGEATLFARRPGYESDDSANAAHQEVTVGSGDPVSLTLSPLCAITGELLVPGDDIPDALQVQLLRREIQDGRAHWSVFRSTDASSEGRFRFGNLSPGAYLVHVSASLDPAPAQPTGAAGIRTGYVPAFYPGTRDLAGAQVLTLTPGRQVEAKMELTREPYYPVALPVANYDQARGVSFNVVSDSFLGLRASFSSSDGMVHIDLPSGHYVLEAHSYGPRNMTGQKEFDVNGGTQSGRTGAIVLLPATRIPVVASTNFTHSVATRPDGSPLTAANLVSITLQRVDDRPATRGGNPTLQDDNGGNSAITGAAPGKYWVEAMALSGYIASITSGGVDLLTEPLTVGPDGSASPISVSLRDDWSSFSAAAATSLLLPVRAAAATFYLQLVPLSGAALARHQVSTTFQPDGTAVLDNVAPGRYLAFGSTTRQQIEYRNLAVLAAYAGKGQAISLNPGGTAHITIDSLLDPNGAP